MKQEGEIVHENRLPLQQILWVGAFWLGLAVSVYLVTTTSTTWGIVLGALIFFYREYWLQKRKKYSVLPSCFLASRFYDVLFNQPKENKKLASCFKAGHFFLIAGFVIAWTMATDLISTRYLKDMEVVRARYEGAKELNGKGRGGDYLISFTKDDGQQISLFSYAKENDINILNKHKESGELYTLWVANDCCMFYPFYPEFRRRQRMHQIVGGSYQRLLNEERLRRFEQTERFLLNIGLFLICCSVPFYLYGWFIIADRRQTDANTMKIDGGVKHG